MRENKRELGTVYEELAANFLEKQGMIILERNFRCRSGEIDLIVKDNTVLVFVEVKYRFNQSAGNAADAVNIRKQRMISKTASFYLYRKVHSFDVPCRFDVIAFDGDQPVWIQNAFDYQPSYTGW